MLSLRTKVELFAGVVFIVLALLLKFYYGKFVEQKHEKDNLEVLFSKKNAVIEYYKNKRDQEVAKTQAAELETKTIKNLVKQGNLDILKDFDNLKKNYSNLESAYQSVSKVNDSLKVKLQEKPSFIIDSKKDTIKFIAHNFNYEDKWSNFKLNQVSPDSAVFDYSVTVPLDGVLYWKRKHKFLFIKYGQKQYFSEVTSENPHVKVDKLLTLKVKK